MFRPDGGLTIITVPCRDHRHRPGALRPAFTRCGRAVVVDQRTVPRGRIQEFRRHSHQSAIPGTLPAARASTTTSAPRSGPQRRAGVRGTIISSSSPRLATPNKTIEVAA